MTSDLKKIEKELDELLLSNNKLWVRTYELMSEVEEKKLWKGKTKSYTAWVRELAERSKVNESILWKRKKAGKIYAEFQKRQAEAGATEEQMQAIQKADVSLVNLELAEKVAQGDKDKEDTLINQVIDGKLKRNELNQMWRTLKAEKGDRAVKRNRFHDYGEITSKKRLKRVDEEVVTKAVDIVKALTNARFIPENFDKRQVFKSDKFGKEILKTYTEFPVYSGSSKNSRRIDVLAVENYTRNIHDLELHGIEIKVSEQDLIRDEKVSEYSNFVDYMYFAVPTELEEVAVSQAPNNWGVLTIDTEGKVKMVQKPTRNNKAIFKNKAITTLLINII